MSREKGWELAEEYRSRRPASLDLFLNFLQISEEEFMEILLKLKVHPWEFDPKQVTQGEQLPDMEQWDKTLVAEPQVGCGAGNKNCSSCQ
jgi:hypothetical protein